MRRSMGCIKCCTPSVCRLSVRLSRTSDFLEIGKRYGNFQFNGNIALEKSNYGSKFNVYRSKVKVTGNDNVKIFFRAYVHQKWITPRISSTSTTTLVSSISIRWQRCKKCRTAAELLPRNLSFFVFRPSFVEAEANRVLSGGNSVTGNNNGCGSRPTLPGKTRAHGVLNPPSSTLANKPTQTDLLSPGLRACGVLFP